MSYEVPVPPPFEPPPPEPDHVLVVDVPADPLLPAAPLVRPLAGYGATAAVAGLGGPPPGVTTYRLRGTETTLSE
jgi:hypothetical protein